MSSIPPLSLFINDLGLLYEEGNAWLVETDMAAFYETVDHAMLFKLLSDKDFLDHRSLEYLKAYLPIWASAKRGESISRGLPQGCLASDLFANVFLLSFDQDLSVREFHYLRYVDDIRLLASTREAVQKGMIRIDRNLKTLGLLIQPNKTTVRKIISFEDEADQLAAQLSEIDQAIKEIEDVPAQDLPDSLVEPSLHDIAILGDDVLEKKIEEKKSRVDIQKELKSLFWQSKEYMDQNNGDPFAESHLRFCLYRLDPDREIIKSLLSYLIDCPWLSEAIHGYLRRSNLDEEDIRYLNELISTHRVYDSIPTLAIETLIRQGRSLRLLHGMFRRWLTENNRDWYLLSAAIALGESTDNMSVLLNVISSDTYSPSVRRTSIIQALRIAKDKHEALGIVRRFLAKKLPDFLK